MKYYSQIEQDKQFLTHRGNTDKGFYVEIGANDGVTFSNTKTLEDLGWDGICVECNPQAFEKLDENRTCKKIQCAVYNYEG
jgi:hypothetical protein